MKFVVDEMFGNIMRWLRTLGYDTIYAQSLSLEKNDDSERDESDLIELCLNNHRILVTGDMTLIDSLESKFFKIMEETPEEYEKFGMAIPVEFGMITPCIFLRASKLMDGLKKIYQEFRINLLYDADNSRCSKCNSTIMKIKRKENYKDQIPEGVYNYQKEFWMCSNEECAQIYWKGRHIESIAEKLKNLRSI
ncbi:MAG: hypothetical protein BAJALOKI1v1_1690002 [Promethearchaeota archaeon]|nr:MAG: hypothetical protein BAJALOKI1v1_1690002 [Candidatus Lokiarchaeota archaeon]